MYTSFFGLNEKPFSITPDPRYLYMSARHTEALAHLVYGITESGGFIQLTGEVGTGKTTLIRGLLQQLPENADIALVLNPQLSRSEFLAVILEELGIPPVSNPESIKQLHSALNTYLLENHSRGRRTVLIVDEAQNLAIDVLEQIRLLTNLETAQTKLLQITLIGQPELRQVLSRNDLRQLAQRITGRYHLEPLSKKDTSEYIQHRIAVAGGNGAIFSPAACREAFKLSHGVPRIINVICDRALLGAYTQEELVVTPALMRQAAREIYDNGQHNESVWLRWQKPLIASALVAALLLGGWLGSSQRPVQFVSESIPVAETLPTKTLPPASDEQLPDAELAVQQETEQRTAQEDLWEPSEEGPKSIDAATVDNSTSTVSLDEFLLKHKGSTNTAGAFSTLFSLWGVAYAPGPGNACDFAKGYNLSCTWQQGSLAQLQALNRPAILTLRDNNGVSHSVSIVKLSPTIATLEINQEQLDIPVAELSAGWFGSSLLLWQSQIDPDKFLGPGERSTGVPWLRESMINIRGWNPGEVSDPDYYDDALANEVKEYQRQRRLSVDGLIGAQTQIAINTDLNLPNTPILVTRN
ncbi:MAG: general secretion pathway protein A [Gammaproteobacteria bacterium]|jgi:general secretion pathway protein A